MATMDIVLANPRGFCAGVDRAIEIVKRALDTLGAPIYVRHEVVHNRYVVDELKHRGAVFVEELDEVPDGATVIFSAHGVSQAVRFEADRRGTGGRLPGGPWSPADTSHRTLSARGARLRYAPTARRRGR
jgi:4-hydroxy-3-methylbut-2-enyl diphosphate reductase IspH